jgi:hypothetical protein
MFNQYAYLSGIISSVPEIKSIYRVSGLAGMEEAMQNLRTLTPLLLFSEDDADGYIDLEDGNFDNGFHTFSIVDMVKLGDSADRIRALNACMAAGLKILKRMLTDSRDFGDPVYGFDRSRIEYQRIGPLLNNTYGYMFSYTLRNENFTLL